MPTRLWRWPIIGAVLLSLGGIAVVASGVLPHPAVQWVKPAAEAATAPAALIPAASVPAPTADSATAPAQPAPQTASAVAAPSNTEATATAAPEPQTVVSQAGGPAVQWVSPAPGTAAPAAPPPAVSPRPAPSPAPHASPAATAPQAAAPPAPPAYPAPGAGAVAPATGYAPPAAGYIPPAAEPAGPAGRNAYQACAVDFRTLCAGVEPGQGRGLRCLLQHGAQVSPGCREALSGGRPAPAPLTGAAMRAAIEACWQDFSVLCAGVQPGEGRGAMCLREHAAQLSAGCRDALLAARAAR